MNEMTYFIECCDEMPLNGETLMTKIDDEKGVRNEQLLKRQGGMWIFPDDSMYVYYTPTHWRYAPTPEGEKQ